MKQITEAKPANFIWLDPLSTTFEGDEDCNTGEPILKRKEMSFLIKYRLVRDKSYRDFVRFEKERNKK